MNKQITVTAPLLPNLDDFNEMLKDIWASKWITNNGQYHKQLEAALRDYLKVPHVSLFTNGTLPLLTALQALRITGEVITTPYSFVATTHSIWWAGCKPVFVDIDPRTGNLDPEKIEAAITPRTTAIMPVHCYGKPCDVRRIKEIADTYGLKVIYDAAHAFALEIPKHEADYKRAFDESRNALEPCTPVKRELQTVETESILNWGDMSTLSFHATKVYNTIEGGAMIMPNEETKRRIDYLKNFGFANETTVVGPGINSKMDEMRAAYGLLNLKLVDDCIAARQQVAIKYREALRDVEGITFFDDMPGVKHNYSYFPIFIDAKAYGMTRDELYFKMKEQNVLGRRYFYPLISEFSTYRGLESADPKNLPNAHKMADSVLCLPMHHELSEEDIQRILSCIIR
ncbi:MAG: DegT/DnrJ/EryC1/StrS family aminotransferase [Bacteroidaceae bacterium]|nr:DegT/DnrJ/EryC1/StrS family aminotransferase [Bacteroidaceae bacterium]